MLFGSSRLSILLILVLLAACSKAPASLPLPAEAPTVAVPPGGVPAAVESFSAGGHTPGDSGDQFKPKPRGPGGLECAERLVLLAAKKNVAENYDNSPTSGGYCAMGVRTSLQRSRVGSVSGSLGNAIDYLRTLRPHGFVDNGGRDPRRAPPGAVLVFSGPHTPAYLHNGHFGSPAGDWLGHVTIKGDDGRYYTDGRTREPAIGWSGGVNEAHRRNVAAIFVPGASLAHLYDGKCNRGVEQEEQAVNLSLAASEASLLELEDPAARESGRGLVAEGLAELARGEFSPAGFQQALRLARESTAFDDEGQLVQGLADRLRADPSLSAGLDQFLADQPLARGAEGCKTRVLLASLQRALCLKGAGAQGQDGDAAACGKPLSWVSCLATN